jgi:hypothetical protein
MKIQSKDLLKQISSFPLCCRWDLIENSFGVKFLTLTMVTHSLV